MANCRCIYTFENLNSNLQIRLKFNLERFFIESRGSKCHFDYLSIKELDFDTEEIYCGRNNPIEFISKSKTVIVEFFSDHNDQRSGFSFGYDLIQTSMYDYIHP